MKNDIEKPRDDAVLQTSGKHGTEELTAEDRLLIEAYLKWEPGNESLEENKNVKPYLDQHPYNVYVVRALELFRTLGLRATKKLESSDVDQEE